MVRKPEPPLDAGCAYDPNVTIERVRHCVGKLHTVYEPRTKLEDLRRPEATEAAGKVHRARTVCFLGFGYHEMNLELLGITGAPKDALFIGTGYRLGESGRERVRKWFAGNKRKIDLGEDSEGISAFLTRKGIFP